MISNKQNSVKLNWNVVCYHKWKHKVHSKNNNCNRISSHGHAVMHMSTSFILPFNQFSFVRTEAVSFQLSGKCMIILFWYPQDNEFLLKDEKFSVAKGSSKVFPAQVSKMGLYMVVTIKPGLVLMWDQKTSLFIKLSPQYQVNNQVLTDNWLLHKGQLLVKSVHFILVYCYTTRIFIDVSGQFDPQINWH